MLKLPEIRGAQGKFYERDQMSSEKNFPTRNKEFL
jgi:hypothetical protein